MTKKDHWMPLHVGELLATTGDLNNFQLGVYLRLLMHYWTRRGLPSDNPSLARIAKLNTRAWLNIREQIAPLFTECTRPDGRSVWVHDRLETEIAQRDKVSARRAAAGSKGGHRKAMNHTAERLSELAQFPLQKAGKVQVQLSAKALEINKRH